MNDSDGTYPNNSEDDQLERAYRVIQLYYTPLLVILGSAGNLISITVFYKSKLREQTASLYLSVISFSDTVFLSTVLFVWFVDIGLTRLCSKFIAFLTYVSSELSAWCVVAFTVERFIAIAYPFRLSVMCTMRRTRWTISGLIATTMAVNMPVLFFVVCVNDEYSLKHEYRRFAEYFNIFDTVVSFLIPLASIVILNLCVIVEVHRSSRAGRHLRQGGQSHRATVMLLVVSSAFVLFNLPAYVMRIAAYAMSNEDEYTNEFAIMQRLSHLLFYTNFGINFYLYCLSGRSFRAGVLEAFPRLHCTRTNNKNDSV